MLERAEQLLTAALQGFEEAAVSDNPLLSAMQALDALAQASNLADLPMTFPLAAAKTAIALERAAPSIARATAHSIPEDRVFYLASVACSLLQENQDPEFKTDRQLYAVLLRYEISTVLCRREIAERGDPLYRAIGIRRALAAAKSPNPLH